MRKPYFEKNHITLYLGDSREVAEELKESGAHFNLLLTDPPYGLDQKGKNKPTGVNAERAKASYDGGLFPDTKEYLREVVRPILDISLSMCDLGILTPGVGGWKYVPEPQEEGCMYMPASPGFNSWAHPDYQPIYYYGRPKGNTGKYRCLSHMVSEKGFTKLHPCAKPLVFWKKLMLCGTDGIQGKKVFDPFAGSGTTGEAAQQLGMDAVLVELNEKYCELIAKKCAQDYLF